MRKHSHLEALLFSPVDDVAKARLGLIRCQREALREEFHHKAHEEHEGVGVFAGSPLRARSTIVSGQAEKVQSGLRPP